jgi:L-threonylcarbamoyladenylate synthase
VSTGEDAVAALRAGQPVVLPFDTVYGLAAEPHRADSTERLYRLKGRPADQPSAIVAAGVDVLLELVPELAGRTAALARELLPAPLTLILPNPARRFPWITGTNPEAIGVRVPELTGVGAEVVGALGAVVATSANRPGGPDPSRIDEVPEELRAGAGAVVDGGPLPGAPSTVVDLTGDEPRILREGALAGEELLRRLGPAVRSS